ncbi:MAG: carbon storage regulator CsrA [Clostridiaceae bacterium]|nr:carbon storage regulator CsrA [Clostridiaceae bacterium]
MLVLSRKRNESLLIGKDVKITVLDIDGDKVKIGIDAPNDVVIMRHELLTQTIDYNIESAKQKDVLKILTDFNS